MPIPANFFINPILRRKTIGIVSISRVTNALCYPSPGLDMLCLGDSSLARLRTIERDAIVNLVLPDTTFSALTPSGDRLQVRNHVFGDGYYSVDLRMDYCCAGNISGFVYTVVKSSEFGVTPNYSDCPIAETI